jgi:hypothetical protein
MNVGYRAVKSPSNSRHALAFQLRAGLRVGVLEQGIAAIASKWLLVEWFCPAIDYFVFAIKLSAARVRVMMPVLMVGSASGAHFGECVPGSVLLSTVLA